MYMIRLNKKYPSVIGDVAAERFFYKFTEEEVTKIKKKFPNEKISENLLDDLFTYQIEPIFQSSLNSIKRDMIASRMESPTM